MGSVSAAKYGSKNGIKDAVLGKIGEEWKEEESKRRIRVNGVLRRENE